MNYHRIYRKEADPVSEDFFHASNVQHIQHQIIKQVRSETGVTISEQSEQDVLHFMQAVYNLYGAVQLPDDSKHTRAQLIMDLNYRVIRQCTDNVKSGILMYQRYLHDASTLPIPLDRSTNPVPEKHLNVFDNTRNFRSF